MKKFYFVVCFVLLHYAIFAQNLEIRVINVGWGASLLVKGPDGTTVLLDGGNTGKGTNRVVPYLQSIGIPPSTGLNYIIAGHQHCDHTGGLDEVINAGYNILTEIYYNGSSYASSCNDQFAAAAATTTAGAPVSMAVGTQLLLGNGAKLTCVARNGSIIGGGSVSVSDENDRSIACLIQYGGFDFLWASDLGGGSGDNACTGRSTSQTDVESAIVQAISPGGASPMISSGGIDVLYVNHHGSESSTNSNWMNYSQPAVAVISTGDGQTTGWDLPRKDVVENVLLAQATSCVTAPACDVYQTEEGNPVGSLTSLAGYCIGNITVTTSGTGTFTVNGDGAVTVGSSEVAAAGLPKSYNLDDGGGGGGDVTPPVITNVASSGITTTTATITWTTDEASNSVVEYGTTTSYGSTVTNASLVTSHSVPLSGLTANTLYHYRVKSTDAASNTATSGDFTFTTSPVAPMAPIESFSDGNFTASPVWGGNTTNWQVVASSDAGPGATNSYTLQLNYPSSSSGTRYLRTQRTATWGTSQSWGVWMGRRAQAATASNISYVWLWANGTNLTASTIDGYRLKFGDDTGNDEIVLQRVTNNVGTDIITSSGSVPNAITDYSFLVRVTRTSGSVWTLYTSALPTASGGGVDATAQPSAANTTVNQGSATNSTYTTFTNGYFGFAATHTTAAAARTAATFDQLYFDTNSSSTLSKTELKVPVVTESNAVPEVFTLYPNFPNPFNPTTTIRFYIGEEAFTNIIVLDVLGQEVKRLVNADMQAGLHDVMLDGTSLSSGVYYYRLQAVPKSGNKPYTETRKLVLMK